MFLEKARRTFHSQVLYIPAVLRIIGFPVVTAYKFYVFLVNAGTVIISYACFKKIFKSEDAAFLTSFAYATATYRIVNVYIRAAAGEYSATKFLPLVALAVYQFYTLDSSDWKPYKRYAFVLALGMTGLIGSHILSMEMTVVTLALLCVILWKTTFKKYVLRGYVLAIIETIALSSYFLIPFLDYYRNVEVNINYVPDVIQAIQWHGAYIAQYFAFFQNLYSLSGIERTNFTPGLPLMTVLVAAIALWAKGKASKEVKLYLSFSVFMLFMASDLFPWNYIGLRYQWGKILSVVQFPWRYLGIATIFLTMLLGTVYNLLDKEGGYRKEFYAATIDACVLMGILYMMLGSKELIKAPLTVHIVP